MRNTSDIANTASRLSNVAQGQTDVLVSDGSYKGLLVEAGYESLFDRAMPPEKADELLQRLIGRSSIYPSDDAHTPETEVIRHVFRLASGRRLAISMTEQNENDEALISDAQAMKSLLGEMGVGPIGKVRTVKESERFGQSDGQTQSVEKKQSFISRKFAEISSSLGFGGNATPSASLKSGIKEEQVDEETRRSQRSRDSLRQKESVGEFEFQTTGYESSAILLKEMADHYGLPTPAQLAEHTVYRPGEKGPQLGQAHLIALLERSAGQTIYESLKATEMMLLRQAHVSAQEAAHWPGKATRSDFIPSSIVGLFENGYTLEAVNAMERHFKVEIEDGRASPGMLAYHYGLYALAMHSAADRLVESMATFGNERLEGSADRGRIEVDHAFNPPEGAKLIDGMSDDMHGDVAHVASQLFRDMGVPLFLVPGEEGETRVVAAPHYCPEAGMSVLPSAEVYESGGISLKNPVNQGKNVSKATPLNEKLTLAAFRTHFGADGEADPSAIMELGEESTWELQRMISHQEADHHVRLNQFRDMDGPNDHFEDKLEEAFYDMRQRFRDHQADGGRSEMAVNKAVELYREKRGDHGELEAADTREIVETYRSYRDGASPSSGPTM